ncbi:hypothetical protein SUGI_0500520 [Cryptomeria japonica]|nr:hypothetical protein SUGI_0500520 [Cryptomeria japonica]
MFNSQIIESKNFKSCEVAVREINVDIHSPRSKKRGIEMIRVVSGKVHNMLLAALRPQSISKIEQTRNSNLTSQLVFRGFWLGRSIRMIKRAVNILNNNNGLFTGLR